MHAIKVHEYCVKVDFQTPITTEICFAHKKKRKKENLNSNRT
jgi:hypothetical protein